MESSNKYAYFQISCQKKLLPQPLTDRLASFDQTVKTWEAIQFPFLPWQLGNSQLHFMLSGNSSHTRI